MDKVYLATYSYGMDNSLTMLDKIRTAAEIGYAGVELSGGYEGRTATEINEVLKETGIEVISHVQLGKIEEELPFLAELGAKFVICPMHNFATREEALDLANKLNDLGKKASEYGMKVGYHNHTQEFWKVDGEYLLDIVIKNTDPDYVASNLTADGHQPQASTLLSISILMPAALSQSMSRRTVLSSESRSQSHPVTIQASNWSLMRTASPYSRRSSSECWRSATRSMLQWVQAL